MEVGILLDEFPRSFPVAACQRFDVKCAVENEVVESGLGFCTELTVDQLRGLGDDHRRGDERAPAICEQLGILRVVPIIAVRGCYEGPGVDDDHGLARAESGGEQLVDPVRSARAACSDPDEAGPAARRRRGSKVVAFEEFGREFIDRGSALCRCSFELAAKLVRNRDRRHGHSVRRRRWTRSVLPSPPTGALEYPGADRCATASVCPEL